MMRNSTRQGGIHYAWLIVVACIAFYAIPVGLIGNCAGVYVTPVMEQFGWSRTDATLYMSIQPLCAALVTPFAGKILARFDPRWVLTATSVVFGVSSMLCAFFTEVWQWHIYGVIYGICGGFFLFLAVPTIINIWFRKRNGLAIGIASTGIGVLAAISSPLTQHLISTYDWQTARLIKGFICTILSEGLTVSLLRRSPASMGLHPYGYEPETLNDGRRPRSGSEQLTSCSSAPVDPVVAKGATGAPVSVDLAATAVPASVDTAAAEGATVGQARRSVALYLLMLIAGGFCFCATFMQQIPSFCATGPLGAAAGALAVSITMVGSIIGKPLLGWLSDRVGAVPTGVFASLCGAGGIALAFLAGDNLVLFYGGIGIFGVGYSALSIVSPMLGSQAFGTAHFSEIYSWVAMSISLFSAFAALIFAQLYDATGSFTVDFIVVIATYIVIAALCPAVVRIAQKSWKK